MASNVTVAMESHSGFLGEVLKMSVDTLGLEIEKESSEDNKNTDLITVVNTPVFTGSCDLWDPPGFRPEIRLGANLRVNSRSNNG
jgi:hypothetical protein